MGGLPMCSFPNVLADPRGTAKALEMTAPNCANNVLSHKCANDLFTNYPLKAAQFLGCTCRVYGNGLKSAKCFQRINFEYALHSLHRENLLAESPMPDITFTFTPPQNNWHCSYSKI